MSAPFDAEKHVRHMAEVMEIAIAADWMPTRRRQYGGDGSHRRAGALLPARGPHRAGAGFEA